MVGILLWAPAMRVLSFLMVLHLASLGAAAGPELHAAPQLARAPGFWMHHLRVLVRTERGIARGQEVSAQERASLAALNSALRHQRSRKTRRLRSRLNRVTAQAQFERGLALGRLGFHSSTELETSPLLPQLLPLLEPTGDGTIAGLLAGGRRFLQRKTEREAVYGAADEAHLESLLAQRRRGAHWAEQPASVRDAAMRLLRLDLEEGYLKALATVEHIAAKLGQAPRELRWDQLIGQLGTRAGHHSLTAPMLWDVIAAAVADGDWKGDRGLKLMQLKPGAHSLYLPKAITLAGVTTPRGHHLVDPKLCPLVQYVSRPSAEVLRGVELHRTMRTVSAGQNAVESFAIINELLGGELDHQHVHMPFLVGKHRRHRAEQPGIDLADAYRVASIGIELDRMGRGAAIRAIHDERDIYIDYSDARKIRRVFDHLAGGPPLARSEIKAATIGYRVGIYGDERLEGWESRMIRTRGSGAYEPEHWAKKLDATQRTLGTGRYWLLPETRAWWMRRMMRAEGPSVEPAASSQTASLRTRLKAEGKPQLKGRGRPEAVEKLLARRQATRSKSRAAFDQLATLLGQLHFNRAYSELFAQGPAYLGRVLTNPLQRRLIELSEANQALKMLVHDWRRDTVWADMRAKERKTRQGQVINAQLAGLRAIAAGKDATTVMAHFVKDSGLQAVFDRAQGIPSANTTKAVRGGSSQ